MPRPNKRDLILVAAARCFYRDGITATGVDAIASEAGVSKRTLYNHFPSKDDLVLAYVERVDEAWRATLARWLESADGPVERVLAYFDGYFEPGDETVFRGCSLINAAAELTDPHSPVLERVRAQKRRIRAEIAALVADAGAPEPERVAAVLALLLEGAMATCGIERDRDGVAAAKDAARRILETELAAGRLLSGDALA